MMEVFSSAPCSAGEGPGHHKVLPYVIKARRMGVGAELRHHRSQQSLLQTSLYRECELCPQVSRPLEILQNGPKLLTGPLWICAKRHRMQGAAAVRGSEPGRQTGPQFHFRSGPSQTFQRQRSQDENQDQSCSLS